jgi:hypothetical protein
VAITLPQDSIEALQAVHPDIGWAIVRLLEPTDASHAAPRKAAPDVELVEVAGRGALIVVNRSIIRNLPGVNMIPLDSERAFLALDANRGMSDLELAVADRISEGGLPRREGQALRNLQTQLRGWRQDHALRFHTRSIIVVERTGRTRARRSERHASNSVGQK